MDFYYKTKSTDPYYNLAFEEYILKNKTDGDIFMLWQNDNTVVIGQNQNAAAEINVDYVKEHGVNVVRRCTGGGAVYHDLGNINYSFITNYSGRIINNMAEFSAPLMAALARLGIKAELSGRNDILIEGKKVSGTAERVLGGRILHHGTLLFKSDFNKISGALNVDKSKFDDKAVKSVKSRVGNISDYIKRPMTAEEFINFLTCEIAKNAKECALTAKECKEIDDIALNKYRSWEWNYGKSPKCDRVSVARFTGGGVETHLEIKNGNIHKIDFIGDFMSIKPLDELILALIGCRYQKEEVKKTLSIFMLSDYFGTISEEEILSTIF